VVTGAARGACRDGLAQARSIRKTVLGALILDPEPIYPPRCSRRCLTDCSQLQAIMAVPTPIHGPLIAHGEQERTEACPARPVGCVCGLGRVLWGARPKFLILSRR
jgi:hypothetical protein